VRVTRYAQNSVLIQAGGGQLLIDPGKYSYEKGRIKASSHAGIGTLVITHKHPDHFDEGAVKSIHRHNPRVRIYCTADVRGTLAKSGIPAFALEPGNVMPWEGGHLAAVKADHVVRGEKVPTIGVVVKAGGKFLYITSDTFFFRPATLALRDPIDVLMLPMSNRGVTMDMSEAVDFTVLLAPRIAIPVHCDSPNDAGKVDPSRFIELIGKRGLKGLKVGFGESFDL
jgi:L-ascorbate metabolism protein UlaG (beta-lactamase superfamily)